MKRFTYANTSSTLVDGVTARTIVPAPSIAGERIYVESIQILNKTTGENPFVLIYTTGEVLAGAGMGDFADTAGNQGAVKLDFIKPLVTTADLAILANATTAVGDCYIVVSGYYDK